MVKAMFNGLKNKGNEMAQTLKQCILLADTIQEEHGPYHFAKASSLITRLGVEYNKLLDAYDVIIMPTLNCLPGKILPADAPIKQRVAQALGMIKNTAIFDATGHPALSLNCGFSADEKLPVGLMVVGKKWDEVTV